MMFLKKSQAVNAAALVAIIAGLIILYIIFLPEDDRRDLFDDKNGGSTSTGSDDDDILLMREFPGTIDVVDDISSKQIPNVFLLETTNAKELDRINPFIIRNGVFDKKRLIRTVTFSISNLENTDNIILSFDAKKHEGILTIKLNNNIIFESDIESETVDPIKLNKGLLNKQNSLEFSVSKVGFKFWKTNEYQFENMRIIGDITDKTRQESRNVFTLTEKDLFNIEEVNLRFVPYCGNVADVGSLDISINDRNVFSAVPVCDDPYKQPIPVGALNAGENKVVFKTNKGSYSVEQIKIEFNEKEIREHVFFFELNESLMEEVKDRDRDIILTIEFVDDRRNKRADLNINYRLTKLDEEDDVFTKNLNDFVKEGNNFIEIRPRTRLDIVEIRAEAKVR